MAKVSRPIIYAALAGVVGYAAFVLTEPDAPVKKKTTATTKAAAVADAGFTEADYKAHFARYNQPVKNAFQPEIMPKRGETTAAPTAAKKENPNALTGNWLLTGISAINGIPRILLENGSTHESVFLQQGNLWNGLRVVAIESDSAVLRNAQGKTTRMNFVDIAPMAATAAAQTPGDTNTPPTSAPTPASAFPAFPTTATTPQPTPTPPQEPNAPDPNNPGLIERSTNTP